MKTEHHIEDWLPITKKDAEGRGWDEVDVVIISGDAYVDHPSFGHAVIGRLMESKGLRVAIVPQPNWKDDLRDFKKFGRPRLFFAVTSGCMDSMVNHYTAAKRKRSNDAYTPGGEAGFRPDYAVITYTQILKKLYPETPVIIGGMEASMRRLTHYDYWSDSLKPSILIDSGADLLVYGMGEQPLREIVKLLSKNVPFSSLSTVPQTALLRPKGAQLPKNKRWETLSLASHEACQADKRIFATHFKHIEMESNRQAAKRLTEEVGGKVVVVNPPFPTMTEKEIDASFDLPYTRLPHPKYRKRGPIPAYEMIRFSINMHRGCFGGCSFCAISAHQGKMVVSRSKGSIMKEVEAVTEMPGFKGYISDLGGPSANMYRMTPKDMPECTNCARPSCIYPKFCANLNTDHRPLTDIYKTVAAHPKVKKAFVTSGVRYDLFLGKTKDEDRALGCSEYMEELVTNHVSGRLKVAPEHSSDRVLRIIRKPSYDIFTDFKKRFDDICRRKKLKQQIIPYFISSHPGSELADMADIALRTKESGFELEQVQDFTPTPMTLSTAIYYSGYHPYTLKPLFTARTAEDKKEQNRFFFWHKKENIAWIRRALEKAGLAEVAQSLLSGGRKKQL
ncbi:MAG: YgiQ family radical SAM protein [Proteobacteria bacterium]|nr:YgiQ family radical SAM protein [Pseudomonadota bacterium]